MGASLNLNCLTIHIIALYEPRAGILSCLSYVFANSRRGEHVSAVIFSSCTDAHTAC